MTEEDIILVLKDLSIRLPYGVKCDIGGRARRLLGIDFNNTYPIMFDYDCDMPQHYKVEDIKPYLRPMSSMTEKEKETYEMFFNEEGLLNTSIDTYLEWILEGHFDFRGLISMGLAIAVTEENNPYNTK